MPLLWFALIVPAIGLALVVVLAREITRVSPSRRREYLIDVEADEVLLVATSTTRLPGLYGLITPERTHAQVGRILHDDGMIVRRALISSTGTLTPGPVRWSGGFYTSPAQIGPH